MAEVLAKAIALPGKVPPVRFPSFPTLERTAVMGFNANFTLAASAGDTKVMLTRSPVLPMWADYAYTIPVNGALTYGVVHQGTALPAYTASDVPGDGVSTEMTSIVGAWHQLSRVGVNIPVFTNGPGGNWPTRRAVVAIDPATGPTPWVWAPAAMTFLLAINAAPYAYDATVTLESWVAPGKTAYWNTRTVSTAVANNSAGVSFGTSSTNRWIRVASVVVSPKGAGASWTPTVSFGTLVTTTVPTFTPDTAAGIWAIPSSSGDRTVFLPSTISSEIDNSLLPWSATRLTAVAALLTNTTKVLNKEGTALWGRINPVLTDPFRASAADLQQLHPAEKAFMDLEQGCYVYNPPSTDITRMDSQLISVGTTPYPVFDLSNSAFYVVGILTDPDGGTSLAVNLDYHLEFRTSSTLFQIGVATATLEALHTAQIALLKHGFFFHNADHVTMIKGIISALASLHPLLRVAAPLAKGLYQTTSYALQSRPGPQQRPTATSGQRSGIVSTRPPRRRRAKVTRPKTNPRPAPKPRAPKAGARRSGLDMYLESRGKV